MAYANVNEIKLSPEKPVKGDIIKILVKADPKEEVKVSISFKMSLPTSEGRYEYRLKGVKIPSTPNSFTVKAENVKNLYISVKVHLIFWVTKGIEAEGGVATLSQTNVPAGTYDIVIHGDAVEEASQVTLQIKASTKIITDEYGIYEYSYDTSNIPPGTFTIKVGDITKTITLYESPPTPSSKPTVPQKLTPQEIELMPDENAAKILSSMTPKNAAAILEEVSDEKAARILSLIETKFAVEIIKMLTISKATYIINAMQTENGVRILQGLVEKGFENVTAKILCEISDLKASRILVETEITPAIKILEEIIKNNVTMGARLVENAVNINLTKTARIIENMQTTRAAELIIEVSRSRS